MKRIVCLGPHVDKEKGFVTGLAMMHDLFVSIVKEQGFEVKAISINGERKSANTKIAAPGMRRYLDFVPILWKLFCAFAAKRKGVFYFNPSTAKTGFYRDVLVIRMAKLFGYKVLMQQFGALFESFKNSLSDRDQKMLVQTYNRADMIIVEGEHARNQYPFIQDQTIIKVIKNGLPELNKNITKTPKTYTPETSFNMFFMNNMIESKGYVDVLKAVEVLVNEKKKNVTCTFAGRFMELQGDEYFKSAVEAKDWFFSFVEQHNLKDRVFYHNSVFDKQKEEQFRKAHVFLLPSYYLYEGQPTAVLEALSYGCVPVVTKYRLIPDMVNEECGVFVNAKSPDSIVNAIEQLMGAPNKYDELSRNSYERFNAEFTQEAYAERIIDAIKTL